MCFESHLDFHHLKWLNPLKLRRCGRFLPIQKFCLLRYQHNECHDHHYLRKTVHVECHLHHSLQTNQFVVIWNFRLHLPILGGLPQYQYQRLQHQHLYHQVSMYDLYNLLGCLCDCILLTPN